jgi:hypothetical protein
MTDYINKQDAYRIALHDGGPVCAEKIAQLEPRQFFSLRTTLRLHGSGRMNESSRSRMLYRSNHIRLLRENV